MFVRSGLVISTVALLLTVFGCGMGSTEGPSKPLDAKSTSPIQGTLTIDGKVPSGLIIFLVPEADVSDIDVGAEDADFSTMSGGSVDASGKIGITTYLLDDGAPAGKYVVVLYWTPMTGDIPKPATVDAFNRKYGNAKRSDIKITVEDGKPTDLGTLDLKTN